MAEELEALVCAADHIISRASPAISRASPAISRASGEHVEPAGGEAGGEAADVERAWGEAADVERAWGEAAGMAMWQQVWCEQQAVGAHEAF